MLNCLLINLHVLAVTEVCDRFSTIGFHANMITYLTQQLNLPLVKASNIVSNFNGTASLTPLIGALIADSFAGRFWTIIVGSIIYELVHPSHSLGIFIFYNVAVQISYLKVQMIFLILMHVLTCISCGFQYNLQIESSSNVSIYRCGFVLDIVISGLNLRSLQERKLA